MNLLTSDDNFNVIKSVLQMAFQKKSIDINNHYDNDIKQALNLKDASDQEIFTKLRDLKDNF